MKYHSLTISGSLRLKIVFNAIYWGNTILNLIIELQIERLEYRSEYDLPKVAIGKSKTWGLTGYLSTEHNYYACFSTTFLKTSMYIYQ